MQEEGLLPSQPTNKIEEAVEAIECTLLCVWKHMEWRRQARSVKSIFLVVRSKDVEEKERPAFMSTLTLDNP